MDRKHDDYITSERGNLDIKYADSLSNHVNRGRMVSTNFLQSQSESPANDPDVAVLLWSSDSTEARDETGQANQLLALHFKYRTADAHVVNTNLVDQDVFAPRALIFGGVGDGSAPRLWIGQANGTVTSVKYTESIEQKSDTRREDWDPEHEAWTGPDGRELISDMALVDIDGNGLIDIATIGHRRDLLHVIYTYRRDCRVPGC